MQVYEYHGPTPEAFSGFLEGVQDLKDYLASNHLEKLQSADKQLTKSLSLYPDFAPAKYYKAIVLTHGRQPAEAITLLEQLGESDTPFKAEVFYNLAFAYARTYRYDKFKTALELLEKSDRLAHRRFAGITLGPKRLDLVFLITAMKAWVMAAFAGRTYGHEADFKERRLDYLPKSVSLARSILDDLRLKLLPSSTRSAVEMEAHNAAGIAFMRMGQYIDLFKDMPAGATRRSKFTANERSDLFGKTSDEYWKLASEHFNTALSVHPGDVRVLDNLSTLNLIQACDALMRGDKETARKFSESAKETAKTSIANNKDDRFRHYNLAKAQALLNEWDDAGNTLNDILTVHGVLSDESVAEFSEKVIKPQDKRPILKQYFEIPPELTAEQLRD